MIRLILFLLLTIGAVCAQSPRSLSVSSNGVVFVATNGGFAPNGLFFSGDGSGLSGTPQRVLSVNGQTGVVTIASGGVTSWNGQTGSVTFAPGLVNSFNGQTGAVVLPLVTSFNGATGAVTYAPSLVNSFNGKTGAIVQAIVTSVNSSTGNVSVLVPVQSVNGQTGTVTIAPGVTSFNGATGAVSGVTSLNGFTGQVTLVIGAGLLVTTNGHTITITTNGMGGTSGPTLFDVYEATFGSLNNLRPTNTVPPSISGDVTNGATVTLSFGTFYSIKPSSVVTNQCGVWVDDGTNGFWGQRGTSTGFSTVGLNTGFVLYACSAVSNQFGWGSAVSAGITITNATVGGETVQVWIRDDLGFGGGSGYALNDVLTVIEGTPVTEPLQVTVTQIDGGEPDGPGVITAVSGNAPYYFLSSRPPHTGATWSGGTGNGFGSVQIDP